MPDYDRMDEWNIDRDLPRRRPDYRQDPRMAEVRRRRKKRQRTRRIIFFILLIILLVGAIGVGAYFLIKNMPGTKAGSDTYVREVNVTDMIAGNMAVWLSDIEGEDIDALWVKSRCNDFTVRTVLTLGKDADGSAFSDTIDENSYNALCGSVDDALNNILSEVIANRLISSGYAESVSSEEAANIAIQVLGMSMSDYIRENGVSIVPTMDELDAYITLGSGKYNISKGVITLNRTSGETVSENVIEKNNSFVLVDSGRVYVKEENGNE